MHAIAPVRNRIVLVLTSVLFMSSHAGQCAPGDEFWDDRFDALGIDGQVWAIAVMGNDVYVGGRFSRVGDVGASNIARWDGTNWWPLGQGIGDVGVQALAVSGTNLYVGGMFATAGGADARGIAKWDGTAWSALGGGLSGSVQSLAVNGTDLYVGGRFSKAGGIIASNIAKWDGSDWWALDGGVSFMIAGSAAVRDHGDVFALAADASRIYVGGYFDNAGGLNTRAVASWDGTVWKTVGQGVDDFVQALAMVGPTLYVGGAFRSAGGVTATNIARWDGQTWSDVGGGLKAWPAGAYAVLALAARGSELFAAGAGFQIMGSTNVALWNGFQWEGMGSGLSGGEAYALAAKGNELFVGGRFTAAGGKPSRSFAIWHIPEKLSIRRSPNSFEVSWPISLSDFVLEASTQLPGTNWTEVRKAPALQNERFSITDEGIAPQQFYRLKKKE